MTTGGAIQVYNVDSINTAILIGTSPALTLGTWYRVDILIKYNALGSGGSGSIRIFFNGVLVVSATVAAATGGLGDNSSKHQSSQIGNLGGTVFAMELDVDDWINCDIPTASGSENLTSLDWLSGSHVQRINPTALGVATANWTGDYRVTLENPPLAAIGTLTSSVSGAPLEVQTDAADDALAQFGAASMCVGMYSSGGAVGAVTGQLGYSIAGGATVLAPISQPGTSSFAWQAVMYRPTGLTPTNPPPYPPNSASLASIVPVVLEHVKAPTADASVVKMFQATVEYIGAWGTEDGTINSALVPPIVPSTGVHNAPYPLYDLAKQSARPIRAVGIVSGTYVGNSLGQDIAVPAPVHWWWVRRVTGSSTGANQWHSSGISASVRYLDRLIPDVLVRAVLDSNGARVQISGNDPQINLSGETYQYVAVSDPGMRFMICGAYMHGTTVPNPSIEGLVDNTFTPDAAFLSEQYVNQTTNLAGYWYKGPGYAAASAQRLLSGGVLTNQLTFGTGSISTQDQLHPQQANGVDGQVSYAVFRMVDGSGDPGVVFQILSYTGDGTGPRTITLTPTSLRWPLFVELVSHTATTGWFRDPSHTGNDSSTVTGTIVTNAITGVGIDLITVGSAANANGVVYDIFAIPGSPTGATNGAYQPVAAISTPSPVFPGTPPPPQPPPPVGCHDDWGTSRPDGLPYIPLSPP